MAKAKPTADPLIAGLRAAVQSLPALLPMVGTKGKALFAKGDATVAERAVTEGYLARREIAPHPVKGRKKPAVAYGVLTEAGAKKVALADGDDGLRPALLELRDAVSRLAAPRATGAIDVAGAIDRAAGVCAAALSAAVADMRAAVIAAVAPAAAAVADPAPVLSAIQAALNRVGAEPTIIRVPVLSDAPPVLRPPESPVPDEIVAFVTAVARERSVGCDFVELYDHLRAKHRELTIGAFHDALRALDDAGRVRLKDWPRMLDEMPRPELALFVTHTVMYHVQPAQ